MPFPVALRASLRPSFFVLALVALSAAGCSSDTSRFESPFSNPFASKPQSAAEVTGSINSAPQSGRVESQPLPAPGQATGSLPPPTRPAAMQGGKGISSYQPAGAGQPDVTGTVRSPQAAWDWNGGTAVIVAQGDTLETLAKRHGVPASAIMQANAITSPTALRPGQRLVIPRYNHAAAAPQPKGQSESATHTVAPGETMIGIAKRYNVTLKDLAKANRVEPHAQVKMGDRLVIPGRMASAKAPALAAKPAPAPAQPQSKAAAAPATKVASTEPSHTARAVSPTADVQDEAKGSASGSPSFRWPVRGRIIAGFGPKPNGQQNDGINLSVPEGTPIKAAEDGVVAYAGNELKGYGNLVLIRHPNGFVTAYAHASELLVKRGDTIKRGQIIAKAGQTGTVSSPQVHFEIRKGSSPVDPTQYLNGA
ncbi:MAG TPA: M23 family metallopeptidase [Xanthobacteraceae bacterium]|nr:M23 family metallopeptidase [Xanthobacteraceae bacterium]